MIEQFVTFQEGLQKGLRPTAKNNRNVQYLIQATGMFPEEGSLRSVPVLTLLSGITELEETFPFPQIHVGQNHLAVFGETTIWELQGSSFVEMLTGLDAGSIWSVADFHDYLLAANGEQVVKRDAITHTWSVVEDENIPVSYVVAAVNGQLIVGSPLGSV